MPNPDRDWGAKSAKPRGWWHREAYEMSQRGASLNEIKRKFKTTHTYAAMAIEKGKALAEQEIAERKRAVQGEPLIPLPPREKVDEACRLFAAGEIDIGELSKRLRGRT